MKVCTITKYDIWSNGFCKQKCIGNFYEKMYLRLLVGFQGKPQIISEKYAVNIRDKHARMLNDSTSIFGRIINKIILTDGVQRSAKDVDDSIAIWKNHDQKRAILKRMNAARDIISQCQLELCNLNA